MKVLFVGLGSIGQRHIRNLRMLLGDNVEILAYRRRGQSPLLNPDMTVRSGADLETTYDIRSFTNLDDALAQRPEVVFVTNPNSLHLPTALAAAHAGCHLFIEKPLSHSLDGVDELIELVERKGLLAFVAYQFRFHPGLQLVQRMIDEGRLGQLASAHIVNGEYLPDWHPYEDYRETHPARRELGGGCLRIQTHELDYALWLLGLPTRVFAVGGHLSRLEVDVEDCVSILMECQSGGRALPVHIHLDYLQRPPQRTCEIVGDAGKVVFDYYANQVRFYDTATRRLETYQFQGFERNQMFLDELRHFLACLRSEEKVIVDLKEAKKSLLVQSAAEQSLQSGEAARCTPERTWRRI
ncbi:MAG: Gfo/Idh/MocA family oxidoreductase [Acidobacteria bacterium]|nr:Gfo/Idh/MocA family oxidoreductase [Acidobacteriota bacterium]